MGSEWRIEASVATGYTRLAWLGLLMLLAGCTTTGPVKQIDRLDSVDDSAEILVMTPDVKYYLIPASGVPQPHAEWTEAARENFSRALTDFAAARNIDIIHIPLQSELTDLEISYQKLYSAVGSTILTHHYGEVKLPTKKNSFDWTLGPGVEAIAAKYDADYVLFTFYRDYEASGGRLAMSFFAAVVGVGLPTGGELGFASLVDLESGDIVWFNRIATGPGELRNPDTAHVTVEQLFKDIPANQ